MCLRYVLKIDKRVALRLQHVNFWPHCVNYLATYYMNTSMSRANKGKQVSITYILKLPKNNNF